MSLVYPTFETPRISTEPRILLVAPTADSASLLEALRGDRYSAVLGDTSRSISAEVRKLLPSVDLVLLDLTTSSHEVVHTIQELRSTIGICVLRPRLLCFSTLHRSPHFILDVQKRGAQYVRVSGPEMLLEAIDVQLAELGELERNGPCFHIIHRFSQGTCAPGEEISAILLEHSGNCFQVPLGLTERLVFDFVAQRRLAVDSLQIVSGLSGDWFYREHAANSGRRQMKRLRRATIKVSAQRIRNAMASTFEYAKAGFDPYDVLRSCFAEGTNRVLYKLCARIRWQHLPR